MIAEYSWIQNWQDNSTRNNFLGSWFSLSVLFRAGGKTDQNAHPHMDFGHRIALVHNGTINNAHELRADLEKRGIVFKWVKLSTLPRNSELDRKLIYLDVNLRLFHFLLWNSIVDLYTASLPPLISLRMLLTEKNNQTITQVRDRHGGDRPPGGSRIGCWSVDAPQDSPSENRGQAGRHMGSGCDRARAVSKLLGTGVKIPTQRVGLIVKVKRVCSKIWMWIRVLFYFFPKASLNILLDGETLTQMKL